MAQLFKDAAARESQSFDEFLKARKTASDAYIEGDFAPLSALLTTEDPASFMPPSGAVVRGARASSQAQEQGARQFRQGSRGSFEIIQSHASGDLGFWTGLQPADVMMEGKGAPQHMTLRVTEVFRREDGAWKLVHRHADMAKEEA